jgi:hypothetical protein
VPPKLHSITASKDSKKST